MKKIMIALLLTSVWMGCEPSLTEFPSDCIRVKVIDNVCGNVVLQIQDDKYKPLGEGWVLNGVAYSGCFFSMLDCATTDGPASEYFNQSDPFDIRIVGAGIAQDPGVCIRCLAMIGNPPSKVYQVKVSADCASEGSE